MKMMAHVPNTLCMWGLTGLTCMLGIDDLGENPVQEYQHGMQVATIMELGAMPVAHMHCN
jgi:hypothetical protein